MKSIWLIANGRSGSTGEEGIRATREKMEALGASVTRFIDLADEDLPDSGDAPPDAIASLGGDGTAHAVIARYGPDGRLPLMILPGGTMNLLSGKLHGRDADVDMILEKLLHGPVRECRMPLLKGPGFASLVGVIAGPATAWGEVRENLRGGGLGAMLEKIRKAFDQTFGGARIRIAGMAGNHSAIFIEPRADGLLHALSVRTEGLGDLAAHGWAWLNRDFLGGPTEKLTENRTLTLEGRGRRIGLLVDGERKEADGPLRLEWAECPARFLATMEEGTAGEEEVGGG